MPDLDVTIMTLRKCVEDLQEIAGRKLAMPINHQEIRGPLGTEYFNCCPKCNKELEKKAMYFRFCPFCGQALRWN